MMKILVMYSSLTGNTAKVGSSYPYGFAVR